MSTYNWQSHVRGNEGEGNNEELHVVVFGSALDVEIL